MCSTLRSWAAGPSCAGGVRPGGRGLLLPLRHLDELAVGAVRAAGYHYGCAIRRSQLTGPHAMSRICIGDRDGSLRLLTRWYRHHLGW